MSKQLIINGKTVFYNQTPLGVQDGSRVEGSGGASIEAPSTAKAEPITDRRYGLRRRLRKKRDPQFVYSEADLRSESDSTQRYSTQCLFVHYLCLKFCFGLRVVVFKMVSMIVL